MNNHLKKMTEPFRYISILRFSEINYHCNKIDLFVKYFDAFLEYFELQMPSHLNKNFENSMNYLYSISPIMLEKFLCSYFHYAENNTNPLNLYGFDYYVKKDLEDMNEKSSRLSIRVFANEKLIYSRAITIKLNKDNIFYINSAQNIVNYSIFDMFKKEENNKKHFINTKDLIIALKQFKEDMNKQEMKAFRLLLKSHVGKPIINEYQPKIIEI